jgi:hypothetical protein
MAVLVGLLLATASVWAAPAGAEVLVDQPPGPSGVGVRADYRAEYLGTYEDFVVPYGAHWHPEAIQVCGKAAIEHPRTFVVKILWGGGGEFPIDAPSERIFSERVTVAGGPDYLIPLEGAPRLDHPHEYDAGNYWISVQAISAGEEDDWYWLTGPNTPGTQAIREPPAGAEPGLGFQLLGTATQIVKATVSGSGTITSTPPGISCPGSCEAEFRRGSTVTFSAAAAAPTVRFVEWGFRNTGFSGPSGALTPIVIPSPCGGPGGCAFTVEHDTNVGGVFEPISGAPILGVVHDRRTGRGQLLVSAPGEGELDMVSPGLRSYSGIVPAGSIRVPLIPTKRIAKALRKKGRATVYVEVRFRWAGVSVPAVTSEPVTLFRKRTKTPSHKDHR